MRPLVRTVHHRHSLTPTTPEKTPTTPGVEQAAYAACSSTLVGSKARRIVAALFWDALARSFDPSDGLLAATGPRCDVAEGVVARVESESQVSW